MRTCPSRPPVATRWYERPHEGAHDTEVIAYGAVPSSEIDPKSTGGEGSRERRVIGRREGDSCIIYRASLSDRKKKKRKRKSNLHNARHAAAGCEHFAPISLLTPGDRPPAIGLAATSASLRQWLLLLLLQRVRNEQGIRSGRSGDLSRSGCRVGMWMRCRRRRKCGKVRLFYKRPVCENGGFEALVHAQMIVRSNCGLSEKAV